MEKKMLKFNGTIKHFTVRDYAVADAHGILCVVEKFTFLFLVAEEKKQFFDRPFDKSKKLIKFI